MQSPALGLQRASLYRYLQIYDWAREFHPGWLARKPKGFIPELTDAYALMWIDHHLADVHLGDEMRRTLERLRAKALAGKLSLAEFQVVERQARDHVPPIRSLLSALRVARRRAAAVPRVPAELLTDLDAFIARVDRMLGTTRRVGALRGLPRVAPAARRKV